MASAGVTLAIGDTRPKGDNPQENDTNSCVKKLCGIPWVALCLVLMQFVLGIYAVTLTPDFIQSCEQFGWDTGSWFIALIIGLIIIGTFDVFIAIFNWLTSMHCLTDGCGKHCLIEEHYDDDGEERNAFCGKNMLAKCCGDWMQWFVISISYIFSVVFAAGSVLFAIGMCFTMVLHGACEPYLTYLAIDGDLPGYFLAEGAVQVHTLTEAGDLAKFNIGVLHNILMGTITAMQNAGLGYIYYEKDLVKLKAEPLVHCKEVRIGNTALLSGVVIAMCCVQYHLTMLAWGNIKGSRGAEVYRQKAEDMIAPQQRAMKRAIKNTDI